MKKKIIFPIVCITVLLFAFALVACSTGTEGSSSVYTIRFNNNYDGGVTKTEVVAGEQFSLATDPVRPGYKFAGWYLDGEGTSEQFTAATELDGDITVFAKWEKDDTKCVVTYKYRNYVATDTVAVIDKGGTLQKPVDPKYDENETYAFGGWYTDDRCTIRYDFSEAVSGDLTLFASWSLAKATVKFNVNYTGAAEIQPVIVDIGAVLQRPQDPVRPRYAFVGWFTASVGGDLYNFDAPVEEEFTLYAHWERDEFTVTFDLNGGSANGLELSCSIKRGTSVKEKADAIEAVLTYVGHEFRGWYTVKTNPNDDNDTPDDSDKADLETITDDIRIYAAWSLAQYTVSFDYNYAGAPDSPPSQKVKYGNTINAPSVATRAGYVFVGWFETANINDKSEQFTLDKPVTAAMSLYALWVAENSAKNIKVDFVYIVDGVEKTYQSISLNFNTSVESRMPENPQERGYYFDGWYMEEQFTTALNVKSNRYIDIKVYGKMLKQYVFEAEAVNFEGKAGQGTSTNSMEEGMIMNGNMIADGNVSNDYFVREMYYNGAFLEFEITAERAVNDAVIYLRISSESYEFDTTKTVNNKKYSYLSDQEYLIAVNPTLDDTGKPITGLIKYDGLYIPMANLDETEDLSPDKTPFEDCFIAAKVHLNAGLNRIMLYVNNNNNKSGTFHAEAPMVDCMYIYSSVPLTMKDYKYYTRPGVQGQ